VPFLGGAGCSSADADPSGPRGSAGTGGTTSGNAGAAGATTSECGGAGVIVGGSCVCDRGYVLDPADSLLCIADPNAEVCSGHGTVHIDHCHCETGNRINRDDPLQCDEIGECNGYGTLVDGVCECTSGSTLDPTDPTRCLSPDCDGRGYLSKDHCHCDLGYTWPEGDPLSCVDIVCGHHGDVVDGACLCHEGFELDPADPLTCVPEPYTYQEGRAVMVDMDVHHDRVKLDVATMTVSGAETETWDLWLAYDGPGSNFHLGEGHMALNLGNELSFHEVTEAPESGYAKDFPSKGEYVIGTSFSQGSTCTAPMTHNIYVIKLQDGTFVKTTVVKSASGLYQVWVYHQVTGSRDLATSLPEEDDE